MSLQIISKCHAKILETFETFPLLFPTFSFVFLQLFMVLKKNMKRFITKAVDQLAAQTEP
jgi:predicted CDP-diglyceride synthetase/phosphatidate cytidylyltransferase